VTEAVGAACEPFLLSLLLWCFGFLDLCCFFDFLAEEEEEEEEEVTSASSSSSSSSSARLEWLCEADAVIDACWEDLDLDLVMGPLPGLLTEVVRVVC